MDDQLNLVDMEEGTGERVDPQIESAAASSDDSHPHCHSTRPSVPPSRSARNQLIAVSIVCTVFMTVQIIGGYLSRSLSIITDATHMAGDLASFMTGLFSLWLAEKPPSNKMTYGFHRAEIVGALLSILTIWSVTAVLVYLAIQRIVNPHYVIKANEMLITAVLGVFFNVIMVAILHGGACLRCIIPHSHLGSGHSHSHGSKEKQHYGTIGSPEERTRTDSNANLHERPPQENLAGHSLTRELAEERKHGLSEATNINIRAAVIHVIGDLIQSCGVLIAAFVIKVDSNYKIADPICTFIFSVIVLLTTITVLKDVFLVIMQATPNAVDFMGIYSDLQDIPGVQATHSLHVWALTMNKFAASVHIAVADSADWNIVVKSATKSLRDKHGIHHSTIQVERYDEIMATCHQCTGPIIEKQ